MNRAEEIINYAMGIREFLHTNDPYKIAAYYGIQVKERVGSIGSRPAYTNKTDGYPTIICIMSNYTAKSKKILCAHELGHALLHSDGYNTFDVTRRNKDSSVEYEANVFALALLSGEKALSQIKDMSPYAVKMCLDRRIVREDGCN